MSSKTTTICATLIAIVHAALRRPIRGNPCAIQHWSSAQGACRIAKRLKSQEPPIRTVRAQDVQVSKILTRIEPGSVYLVVQGHFVECTTNSKPNKHWDYCQHADEGQSLGWEDAKQVVEQCCV